MAAWGVGISDSFLSKKVSAKSGQLQLQSWAQALYGALGVVDDHAQRHTGEPLEGATVAAQPGGHRLVPDEFHILVASKAQVRQGWPTRVDTRGAGAEDDLGYIAGFEVQSAGGLGRQLAADVGRQAAYRRVDSNRTARRSMMNIRGRGPHDQCRVPSLLEERPTHPSRLTGGSRNQRFPDGASTSVSARVSRY